VGSRDLIKLLLDAGIDVNARAGRGDTPIHWAASSNSREIVEMLIVEGADIGIIDSDHGTLLHSAAPNRRKDVMELFIKKGLDVNAQKSNGETPLHVAAQSGNKDVVELLIAHGANVNAKAEAFFEGYSVDEGPDNQATPLHFAVSSDSKDTQGIVEILVKNGADVNARIRDGKTPLHVLVKNSEESVKTETATGFTMSSVEKSSGKSIAEFLIASGADVNAKDRWGNTPFDYIVLFHLNSMKLADLLIAKGATLKESFINSQDNKHRNDPNDTNYFLLHRAAAGGSQHLAELLLAKGVDVNSRDSENKTPLFWAEKYGHREVAALLRQHGGRK
jgi:ankyrin repeat protein